MFLLVIFSFIIFVNEELETSILEILFETCFITVVLFYIPDVFIFGYSFFLNRLNYFINVILNVIIPFVELISYFLKSLILSVRLNTNFISGHLLLIVIFIFLEFFIKLKNKLLSFALFLLLILFYMLEVLVCILQIYVILCLVVLVTHESTW